MKRKKELLEDGFKLGDYKIFTPQAAGGAGGGAGAAGAIAVNIVARGAMFATGAAATGGIAVGTTIVGGIAYACAKNFGWYEIDCSINENVRNLRKKVIAQTDDSL